MLRGGACYQLEQVPGEAGDGGGRRLHLYPCVAGGLGLEVALRSVQLTAQALAHGPDLWGNLAGYGLLVSAGRRF